MLEHWTGDRRNSRKMFQDLQQRGRSPVLKEAVEFTEALTALVRGCEAAQLDPRLQRAKHTATDGAMQPFAAQRLAATSRSAPTRPQPDPS